MDTRSHWESVYATKRPEEVSWFQQSPSRSLALIDALPLPHDASVIDVGGGASALVDHLLDHAAWRVTVLDVAQAALKHSRRRLGDRAGRVRWATGDVTAEIPPGPYDLWHDRAVLHFLTDPGARDAYARNVRVAVRPGGFVIVAAFAPDGPTKCSGLDVVRYDAPALALALGPQFRLIREEREDHATPWGAVQRFVYGVFQREGECA